MGKRKNPAKQTKPKQNDSFIYRFMVALMLVLIAVLLLHSLKSYYSYYEYMDTIRTASGWMALVFAVLGVAACCAAAVTKKKPAVWAGMLLLLAAACAACTWLYYTEGVTMASALVIGAGLLYVARQIYQPEVLPLVGLTGLAAICYYGISKYIGSTVLNHFTVPLAVVLALAIVAVLIMTALAGRRSGLLTIGGQTLRLWQEKSSQVLLYLACVVWAALLVLAFLLGAMFAWYCVLVAGVVIFVLAVWFTIKLM